MAESDYRRAYETAKRELAELIANQERLEKRKLVLRKTIESLAAQCEAEGIQVEPSQEAAYFLEKSLADEIRNILGVFFPSWLRPGEIKTQMERLGRDLSKYPNPQSSIQMVLKRMVESGEVEVTSDSDLKHVYRTRTSFAANLARNFLKESDGGGGAAAAFLKVVNANAQLIPEVFKKRTERTKK